MTQTLWTVLFFFLGSCLGSFASVLIYRLHSDEGNIIFGRSHCCQTGKRLPVRDLIPIFSWIFLGGKSRFSGKKIPSTYFWLEVVFASVFALFAWKFSPEFSVENLWKVLPQFLMVFFVLVLFFYDAIFMEVDRRISWPAILLAGILIITKKNPEIFLIGGVVGFGFYFFQYILSKGRWVGGGDQEFGLLMGVLLGWKNLLLALFASYIVGMVWAIFILSTKKGANRKTALPMGAFLMPVLLGFLYDTEIWWQLYDSIFSFEWLF